MLQQTLDRIVPVDAAMKSQAADRLDALAMPKRALGRLMDLAESLAAMAGTADPKKLLTPSLEQRINLVMAGDHGVSSEGVSQYPQAVTRAMVSTMVQGKASINALARAAHSRVVVVDMGLMGERSWEVNEDFLDFRIAEGTANIAQGPAMSLPQAMQAVEAGIAIAQSLQYDVLAIGEMGIANSTAATALGVVILGVDPQTATGPGTGLSSEGVKQKARVVEQAIEVNAPNSADGMDLLRTLGGFEIGGLVGAMLGAAALRKPIVLDGLISTSAALVAHRLCPSVSDWLIASHLSSEPLHRLMLKHLGLAPYLDLQMRLGEGTGAALLFPLMDAAATLLSEVATLEEVLK